MRKVALQRCLCKAALQLLQMRRETDAQLQNQVSVALMGTFIFTLTRKEGDAVVHCHNHGSIVGFLE